MICLGIMKEAGKWTGRGGGADQAPPPPGVLKIKSKLEKEGNRPNILTYLRS
jgi:hypothetical protein